MIQPVPALLLQKGSISTEFNCSLGSIGRISINPRFFCKLSQVSQCRGLSMKCKCKVTSSFWIQMSIQFGDNRVSLILYTENHAAQVFTEWLVFCRHEQTTIFNICLTMNKILEKETAHEVLGTCGMHPKTLDHFSQTPLLGKSYIWHVEMSDSSHSCRCLRIKAFFARKFRILITLVLKFILDSKKKGITKIFKFCL